MISEFFLGLLNKFWKGILIVLGIVASIFFVKHEIDKADEATAEAVQAKQEAQDTAAVLDQKVATDQQTATAQQEIDKAVATSDTTPTKVEDLPTTEENTTATAKSDFVVGDKVNAELNAPASIAVSDGSMLFDTNMVLDTSVYTKPEDILLASVSYTVTYPFASFKVTDIVPDTDTNKCFIMKNQTTGIDEWVYNNTISSPIHLAYGESTANIIPSSAYQVRQVTTINGIVDVEHATINLTAKTLFMVEKTDGTTDSISTIATKKLNDTTATSPALKIAFNTFKLNVPSTSAAVDTTKTAKSKRVSKKAVIISVLTLAILLIAGCTTTQITTKYIYVKPNLPVLQQIQAKEYPAVTINPINNSDGYYVSPTDLQTLVDKNQNQKDTISKLNAEIAAYEKFRTNFLLSNSEQSK